MGLVACHLKVFLMAQKAEAGCLLLGEPLAVHEVGLVVWPLKVFLVVYKMVGAGSQGITRME